MPSTDEPDGLDRYVLVGIAIVTVLAVLYGVFLTSNLFALAGVAVPLVALYLFWRLVRAHERIASALEADSTGP